MKIKTDLQNFLAENLELWADDHLKIWHERYYRKRKADIKYDLDINYDFSADIESVENELSRELTDGEKEYFITRFKRAILNALYK